MSPPDSLSQLQLALANHLRHPDNPAPAGLDERRLRVYRELIGNNICSFIHSCFPVSRRIHGAGWQPLIDSFVAEHSCRSPLFLDIPAEFLAFATRRWGDAVGGKPFGAELLHYEWMELVVATRPASPVSLWDGAPELPLHLHVAAAPLLYRYPVHQISVDHQPSKPPEQPTGLLVYRDGDDEVRFMALAPLLVLALQLLAERPGQTLAHWVAQVAAVYPQWPKDSLGSGLTTAAIDLARRGLVGGGVAAVPGNG
ncbi:MAG: putative DNA-binding domain-containing protein [Gammaproteobacteria bacterium]|nr:putative DNA-binding domain-containing protein [Gammaproteobacteria bacterium]